MKSLRPHIKLVASIIIFLLTCVPALFLSGCGSEQDSSSQSFKESLRPIAEQAATTMTKASETVTRCTDYAQSSQTNSLQGVLTLSPDANKPNKTSEMEACAQELAQVETAIKSGISNLQTVTPPAGCDSCQSATDSLNAALSDASSRLIQYKESLTLGVAILRIGDNELAELQAIPQLVEVMTEEEWKAYYSSTASIYRATLDKWKALTVPVDFSESIQKIVAAKQSQADALQQEADTGPSAIIEVQMELSTKEINAGMQAVSAVQSAYGAVKKKLNEIENSIREDKSTVDQVLSSLASATEQE